MFSRATTKKKAGKAFDKGKPENLYTLEECLGEGTYGTVWTGTQLSSGRKCAIKIVVIDDDLEEIEQEIMIMKESDSPYIVKFFGSYWGSKEKIWMVMEHCVAGSLNDLMYVCDTTFNAKQIQSVIAAMTLGLEYLHERFIIHRDIKAGNVLLSGDGHIRLADFGVSAKLKGPKDRSTTAIGAPFWMAPEVINEQRYDGRADIWSLGITIIELAESRPPNSHINPMKALFIIPQQDPPTLQQPNKYPNKMVEFLKICLNKNMSARPTSKTLRSHPWIHETVKELGLNLGMSDVMRKLVNTSLRKIEKWRNDDSDDESDFVDSENEEDDESIDLSHAQPELAPDDDRVKHESLTDLLPRPVSLASPDFSQVNQPRPVSLRQPTPYMNNNKTGDRRTVHLNPIRDNNRKSRIVSGAPRATPLRDIVDPRAENRKTFINKANQKDMNVGDIAGLMDSDMDDNVGGGVMTTEFISLLKQIYTDDPDLFGDKPVGDWTGVDITNAVVGAFIKKVESNPDLSGQAESEDLFGLNVIQNAASGEEENFDIDAFISEVDEEGQSPPAPFPKSSVDYDNDSDFDSVLDI